MSGYSADNQSSGKRNQDEISYDGNAAIESIQKKQRMSEDGENSNAAMGVTKVLHVRSLPPDCTDSDLVALACPFGRVVKTFILKGKNQGFIQMEDSQAAATVAQYFNSVPAMIRGRTVYVQFSNRNEITATSNSDAENHILLVTITEVMYPITVDVLEKVFQKHSPILKIVIFQKNATQLQGLVQFADRSYATAAKAELDGQNIYAGCCTLKIQYSNLPNLNVKFNNDKSRDFTNPALPPGPTATVDPAMGMYGDPQMGMYGQWGMHNQAALPHPGGAPGFRNPAAPMSMNGSVLICSGFAEGTDPDTLFNLFGIYGDVMRVKIMYNKQDTCLIQFTSPQGAETALNYLGGFTFRGRPLKVHFSKHQSIMLPQSGSESEGNKLTEDYTHSQKHRFGPNSKNFQHITSPTTVLHISNLQQPGVTEDVLRDLFSQFGNVVAFKFFPDNRMALLQFSSVDEALEALLALHHHQLLTQHIRVAFSKSTINPNRE